MHFANIGTTKTCFFFFLSSFFFFSYFLSSASRFLCLALKTTFLIQPLPLPYLPSCPLLPLISFTSPPFPYFPSFPLLLSSHNFLLSISLPYYPLTFSTPPFCNPSSPTILIFLPYLLSNPPCSHSLPY